MCAWLDSGFEAPRSDRQQLVRICSGVFVGHAQPGAHGVGPQPWHHRHDARHEGGVEIDHRRHLSVIARDDDLVAVDEDRAGLRHRRDGCPAGSWCDRRRFMRCDDSPSRSCASTGISAVDEPESPVGHLLLRLDEQSVAPFDRLGEPGRAAVDQTVGGVHLSVEERAGLGLGEQMRQAVGLQVGEIDGPTPWRACVATSTTDLASRRRGSRWSPSSCRKRWAIHHSGRRSPAASVTAGVYWAKGWALVPMLTMLRSSRSYMSVLGNTTWASSAVALG